MSAPIVLAVDGGNSKTDLALVRADGTVLALVRGPLSSPHHLGVDGCVDVMAGLLDEALPQAGLSPGSGPVADVAQILLAGVDFPAEERRLHEAVSARGWAPTTAVGNDTFAVLRAGTERGWGVAVVCGAGINCVGVARDGRHARFPALGAITGDWGGGYDVGMAAVSAAARSSDGRGRRTSLERRVPAHFGLVTPYELAEAFHLGRVPIRRVVELAPLVVAEAAGDPVAAEIVDRLADEVVALTRAALERLGMAGEDVEVLLGGGLLQTTNGRLLQGIREGLRHVGPQLVIRIATSPPIVGAVLLGLDDLGAPPDAQRRVRAELGAAVKRVQMQSSSERPGDG